MKRTFYPSYIISKICFKVEPADKGPCQASIGGIKLRLQKLQKKDFETHKIRAGKLDKANWEDIG